MGAIEECFGPHPHSRAMAATSPQQPCIKGVLDIFSGISLLKRGRGEANSSIPSLSLNLKWRENSEEIKTTGSLNHQAMNLPKLPAGVLSCFFLSVAFISQLLADPPSQE